MKAFSWMLPALLVAASVHAQTPEMQRWAGVLQAVEKESQPLLMRGDIPGFVAAIRKAAKSDDSASQYIAGNIVYRVSPSAAVEFHEAAARLSPNEGHTRLELALDYQRIGQCERAIGEWQAADKLGALPSPLTAVAARCFFQLGRIDEALALWGRVRWPADRRHLDFLLSEMSIGTLALETHASAYARARNGDKEALKALISNALDWRHDFWNSAMNRQAFDAARDLVRQVHPSEAQLLRELDCAADSSAARDPASLLEVLRRCRMLIGDGLLPSSSAIAKYLVARIDATRAAPVRELLDRHGQALDARARSAQGDLPALELLAFLQVNAGERDALKATDELGWRRYRVAKFASSRVVSALSDKEERSARGQALLREALTDFPLEGSLHFFRYSLFPPAPDERERYFLEWISAEYAQLSLNMFPVPQPRSSTTLASVVASLRKQRAGQ